MSDVDSYSDPLDENDVIETREARPPREVGGSGVEARLARLEGSLAHLDRDVRVLLDGREMRGDLRDMKGRIATIEEAIARIETRAARINERSQRLAGKGFIAGAVIVTLIVVAALLAFQPQLQTLVRQNMPAAASGNPAPGNS